MLGPFTTASRLMPIHQVSPAVLLRAACASMSTTPTTTMTTTTRDRGDRYGPMEWVQLISKSVVHGRPSAYTDCKVKRSKIRVRIKVMLAWVCMFI